MKPAEQLTKTSEDAEDHEVFDINDFTTASDWERYSLYHSLYEIH